MTKPVLKEKCQRALELKKKIDGYKEDFEALDKLTVELQGAPGLEAFGLQIVDQFAEKNTQ